MPPVKPSLFRYYPPHAPTPRPLGTLFICPRVGDQLHVIANQGTRPCTVLARDNVRALVEYEFPNGTTRLCWVATSTLHQKILTRIPGAKALRYTSVPLEWLRFIRAGKMRWKGMSFRGPVPSVVQLLTQMKARAAVQKRKAKLRVHRKAVRARLKLKARDRVKSRSGKS